MINSVMYLLVALVAAALWCYLAKDFKKIGNKISQKIKEVIEDEENCDC